MGAPSDIMQGDGAIELSEISKDAKKGDKQHKGSKKDKKTGDHGKCSAGCGDGKPFG